MAFLSEEMTWKLHEPVSEVLVEGQSCALFWQAVKVLRDRGDG